MALVNYRFEMPSSAYYQYRLEVVFAIPIEDSAKLKTKSEELMQKAKTPVTRNGTARLAWYAFGTAHSALYILQTSSLTLATCSYAFFFYIIQLRAPPFTS
jgi:hypothetical protein